MATTPKLTFARRLAIAAGDFGFNLYWTTASLFLLFFYTDVLKLPVQTAGLIYMIALVLDAAIDPLIGSVADRTRTRFGRYRPYLIFGGPVMAVLFAALFLGPVWPAAGAALIAGLSQIAFRIGYSVVSIPYTALFARVTRDSGERAELAGLRMVFATLSAVFISALTLYLAQHLGQGDARRGWGLTAICYGGAAAVLFWLVAWGARGLDAVETEPAPPRDLRRDLGALGANTPLLIVLGLFLVSQFANTFFQNNLIYYCKYVLGNANLASAAFAVIALELALLVPLWAQVAKRFGKRFAWVCGSMFSLAGLIGLRLCIGQPIQFQLIGLGVMNAGTAAHIVCLWAMLPDTVEFGEWRSKVRTESLIFGLVTLGQKAALGLSGWVLGLSLRGIGYVPNVMQAPATLHALVELMFWPPLIVGVVGFVLVSFYRLDPKTHSDMVADIAAREAAARLTASL